MKTLRSCHPASFRSARLWVALAFLPPAGAQVISQAPYRFTTLAGRSTEGNSDGPGANAQFHNPAAVAADASGNIYVADLENHTIRKIDASGVVSTFAGSAGRAGYVDGVGSAARFNRPSAVVIDGSGNVYAADSENSTIRRIAPDGSVTTFAGRATLTGRTDGSSSQARFNHPSGLAIDAAGNLFVADQGNQLIRKITPASAVTTLADFSENAGNALPVRTPSAVAVDTAGNLYISDARNFVVGKRSPDGRVSLLAGSPGAQGSADGEGASARFLWPASLAVDAQGVLYVADAHAVRRISPQGTVTTLAGDPASSGSQDGTGSAARFADLAGIWADRDGRILLADSGNDAVRALTASGTVTTIAGVTPARSAGSVDGNGADARFNRPWSIAVDPAGNVYVSEPDNNTIRKIAPDGTVSTLAGLAGVAGSNDGTGGAARFNRPFGIAADAHGNVYVADTGNGRIRQIAPDKQVSTFTGAGGEARFTAPISLAIDASGNLYVSDPLAEDYLERLRRFAPDGTIASLPTAAPSTVGLVVDDAGTLYATDGHDEIWKLPPGGEWTFLLKPSYAVSILGGIAVDRSGALFAGADSRILRYAPDGDLSDVGGQRFFGGGADGVWADSRFEQPQGLAFDAAGNLYVADLYNNTIRKGVPYLQPWVAENPAPQSASAGSRISFSVAIASSTAASFRWQRQANGTSPWINLSDGAGFSGTAGAALAIDAVTAAMDGDQFRCVITNANGEAISDPAFLDVLTPQARTVETFVGAAGQSGPADGTGTAARLFGPADLAFDRAGNLYVADANNHTIRKVSPAGVVTTLAGAAGLGGNADGTGTAARFNHPTGVAVDPTGNVLVADTDNNAIRRIDPAGVVTTVAGFGGPGLVDGPVATAKFNGPSGLAVDSAGTIYVADTLNYQIRTISPEGVVSALLSNSGKPAGFNGPQGLLLDRRGHLLVVDTVSCRIRSVDLATGVVSTVAGFQGGFGSTDGDVSQALINAPCAITMDGQGDIYVADTDNDTIRRITPAGAVTTVAGRAGAAGGADGVGADARFNHPTGIAADPAGNLYVADTDNHTIRLAYVAAAPAITSQTQSQTVTVGAGATFSVAVTGRPAPACQWQFNGAAIAGATGRTLSLTNVQPANAGSYTVTATNTSGSVTSNAATLTVNAVAAPPPAGSAGTGGGGAPSLGFLAALLVLTAARHAARSTLRRPAIQTTSPNK